MSGSDRAANDSGDKTLYVRVPAGLKVKLDEAKTKYGESVTYMITRILEYFYDLKEEEQRRIIDGVSSKSIALSRASHLIKQLAWADHAFGQKRWTWAAEEYLELAESSKGEAPGTRQLALYRGAYCMGDIANELRKEAVIYYYNHLKKDESDYDHLDKLFDEADRAAYAGILWNDKSKKESQEEKSQAEEYQDTVTTFNIACCWAIRATCQVQKTCSKLDANIIHNNVQKEGDCLSHWLKDLKEEKGDGMLISSLVPKGWRELSGLDKTDQTDGEAGFYARMAIDSLHDAIHNKSKKSEQYNAFLIDLAHKDLDLEFLREDKKYSLRHRDITKEIHGDMLESCIELVNRFMGVCGAGKGEVATVGSGDSVGDL